MDEVYDVKLDKKIEIPSHRDILCLVHRRRARHLASWVS